MTERTVFQSMPQRHVVSLGPTATVYEAACVMTRANCGSVLVIDAANTLLGIVTERDLMTRVLAKALDPASTPVADVMTRNPQCVPPETKVADAVLIMIERGFRHLPIVGRRRQDPGRVLGARRAAARDGNGAEPGRVQRAGERRAGLNARLTGVQQPLTGPRQGACQVRQRRRRWVARPIQTASPRIASRVQGGGGVPCKS